MPLTQNIYTAERDTDTLGNRMLRARIAGGLSQVEMARNLGVKKTTVESWETDRSEPRANHVVRLSGMLGVSPTWLLDGLGSAPSTETIADEAKIIRHKLGQLRELHQQTASAIDSIEKTLDRLVDKEAE